MIHFNELKANARSMYETFKKVLEYDTAMTAVVESELNSIKTTLGDEKFTKISNLLNLENLTPLQKLQTLPKLKELMGEFAEKKPDPK